MSNYKTHAMNEFRAAGWTDENGKFNDEMQEAMCNHVLAMLEVFADEGHSNFSASYAINLFKTLANYEPIGALTGEDWEWNEASDGVYQNKRMSSVFKQSDRFDGKPYWLNGKVLWEWCKGDDGVPYKAYFTSRESMVPITFPWVKPDKPEYVFRPTEEFPSEILDA